MEHNWVAGQPDFVRYWTLIADAVKDHPSAFAIKLATDPPPPPPSPSRERGFCFLFAGVLNGSYKIKP